MSDIKLVIFDCDGVLVDSEEITNTVFATMLNEIGIAVTLEDMYRDFVGLSLGQCIKQIEQKFQKKVSELFLEQYEKRSFEALERFVKPVDGVFEVLSQLSTHSLSFSPQLCVASSGSHEKMQVTLGKTELLHFFKSRIYSVSDVERPKPYPDVYLHAASSMQVPIENCVVVEDSPTGVKAGVAAGMKVFGYCDKSDCQKLKSAGAVTFGSMRELLALMHG